MADNVNKAGSPLVGGDSENFMRLMNRALTRIEQVDKATNKANQSLNDYAKSFDELNAKLEQYVRLSGNVKSGKFSRITINERVTGSRPGGTGRSTSSDNKPEDYSKQAKKITNDTMNTIFRSIDSLGNEYSRILSSGFKKVMRGVSDAKTLSKNIKAANDNSKAMKLAGTAAEDGAEALGGMSAAALGATAVVAGLVVALGAMAAAGKYAYDANMDINRSLMSMGDTSNELKTTTSKTANELIDLKNTWKIIGQDLGSVFEPLFSMIIDFTDKISNSIGKATSTMNQSNKQTNYTSNDSKARWYTQQLQATSGEPESTSLPVIGNIAGTAKQSGFDNTSAANLAIGTYDLAIKKARQYGVEASDVAKELADAWTTGSDAAKAYGVVVDDQTLAGYMASKGIDIVNVQISDAMKQYYRYQLMEEELSSGSSDAMQNQVKGWKKLGMQIEATKQKLFSFDEVIQLTALDTTIPTVGTPSVSYPGEAAGETGSTTGAGGLLPIGGAGGTAAAGTAPEPVTVPVVYVPENEEVLEPVPVPVTIPVTVPGLDLVPELAYDLGLIWAMVPVPVTIPVTVPGFEKAPELLQYCISLATTFPSMVAFSIPALALAPELLDYLVDIAKTWDAKVNISVAGLELLQRAQALLQQVLSLVQSAGQAVARSAVGYALHPTTAIARSTASNTSNGIMKQTVPLQGYNFYKASNWAGQTYEKLFGGNIFYGTALQGLGSDKPLTTTQKVIGTIGIGSIAAPAAGAAGAAAAGAASGLGSVISGAASAAADWLAGLGSGGAGLAAAFGMADGGIGTKETNIRAFEGNKKEAVIPLETSAGINYLSDAMKEASSGGTGNSGGDITINLTLSGVNIADNEAQWRKVGNKIAEVIEVQRQRRGDLNYGSSI